VLNDDGDRVGFRIQRGKELFLGDLFRRPLGKRFGLTEKHTRIFEVRGCEVECHAISLVRIDLPDSVAEVEGAFGIESSNQNED
jgi:hypothetical protein